ncbi:unnamed protein product, partial [Timema podura]|nr:unnamed protein product [Timema podura]
MPKLNALQGKLFGLTKTVGIIGADFSFVVCATLTGTGAAEFKSNPATLVKGGTRFFAVSPYGARWRTKTFHTGESSHPESNRVQASQESMMRQIIDFVSPAQS